ncbi:hypothetical protein M2165_001846 [Variovorax sp. TBS-050B]|nr:hypothetical protein [Variovorax sp. TBS-050B]
MEAAKVSPGGVSAAPAGRSWLQRGQRPLLLCAGLSLALHAAVLAYRVPPPPDPPRASAEYATSGESDGSGSKVVRLRVEVRPAEARHGASSAPQPEMVTPAPAEGGSDTTAMRDGEASPRSSVSEVPLHRISDRLLPQPAEPSSSTSMPQPPAAFETSQITSTDGFDGSDYLPRRLLTVAPSPVAPIVLGAPEDSVPAERFVGILSVFIDESGRVKHVREDGTSLPPSLSEIARHAFASAFFSPGQLNGAPVKSNFRVEVVFDNSGTPK